MDFLKKLDLSKIQLLKMLGLVLLALVVLSVIMNTLKGGGFDVDTMSMREEVGNMMPGFPSNAPYNNDGVELSYRNVQDSYMPPMYGGSSAGDDLEAFEVREYSVYIETNSMGEDCGRILELKARTDIVFENTNEHDRGCNYTFKVKKSSVEEVLSILKSLDPKELSENTYTIKREISDYTNEVTILENKLATLDSTLKEATASYSDITTLATRMGDVESLAKIIESKLLIIERLTSARIETANQLERVNRAKADALDRLEYTYFNVSVSENKFVDGEEIEQSWKMAMQQFIRDTNALVQEITIGFIALLLMVVKFALYFFVLLFVAKYAWSYTEKIWRQ